jgi:hypothetical protein
VTRFTHRFGSLAGVSSDPAGREEEGRSCQLLMYLTFAVVLNLVVGYTLPV